MKKSSICSVSDMLFLIDSIRQTDQYIADIYLNGGCYQFHLMLKKFAPECEARITKERNHIVIYFKEKYFDITGIVEGQFQPLNQHEIDKKENSEFKSFQAHPIPGKSVLTKKIQIVGIRKDGCLIYEDIKGLKHQLSDWLLNVYMIDKPENETALNKLTKLGKKEKKQEKEIAKAKEAIISELNIVTLKSYLDSMK